MKYAVNPFVMKQGETHVVFSDPSLYTYQNAGTETAVIEGSIDAVTWHHIADVPAGEDLLSVHSHNLRMLNNTVVYVNRGIGAVATVNGKTGSVVLAKVDVGLDNVDNTSDANKPISTSTQDALDLKADLVGGLIPESQLPQSALTGTTYENATTSTDGLMSKEDKTKLDALQQVYIIQLTQAAYDALTPEEKTAPNTLYAITG